jgi:hypothetical protein
LEDAFLSKPENYCLQIERLLVDVTPVVNLIEGPYLEVLRRPAYTAAVANDYTALVTTATAPVVVNNSFTPVNPKTVLDVLYQLDAFCDLHDGLSLIVGADLTISFRLSVAFGDEHYLTLHDEFATLMSLPPYIYAFNKRQSAEVFNDGNTAYVVSFLSDDGAGGLSFNNELFYTEADTATDVVLYTYWIANPGTNDTTVFAWSGPPAGGDNEIESLDTVRGLDQRLSYEVTCTFSSDSKIDVINEAESRKRLIARFPIGDIIDIYNASEVGLYESSTEITERVNMGIEDLTRKNPNTQTLSLHNGEILVVNTDTEVRYLQGRSTKVVPVAFGDSGFFTLMLLFSKRIK